MRVYKKETIFSEHPGLTVRQHQMTSDEPEHLHEFIEIVYVMDGAGVHGINGVEYRVRRGALLFINYRQTHYFKTDREMEICNILLDPEWISEKLIEPENAFELLTLSSFSAFQQEIDTETPLVLFSGGERSRLERLIREMAGELERREPGYETVLKAQINVLLTLIFRKMSLGARRAEQLGLSPDFLQYIRDHCAEKLTLEALSRSCFYNPSYFSRLFKEHYGMTLTAFIGQSRLERARRLLEETSASAEEIAAQAGFSSRNTFYKQFREQFGMTPQAYRKVKKEDKER